jgi:hypothetical protein
MQPKRTCSVDGCERPSRARDLCALHWQRWRRTGGVELAPRPLKHCMVGGCRRKHLAKGWCAVHYDRWKRNGDPGEADLRKQSRGPTCTIAGCSEPVHARELCGLHYRRSDYFPGCAIGGCDRPASSMGLCASHYHRYRRHGDALGGGPPKVKRPPGVPSNRRTNPYGYVIWYFPEHPNAHPSSGNVAEHVMVMVEKLGRPLRKGENVHHKNGARDDNRPSNLELWATAQPAGQRVADLVEWAEEIIQRYSSEVACLK